MNQNYLFSDSLAKIGYDFQNKFKSTPEIQPLILNEFQPYDMLSVADLIPNVVDEAAGTVGNVVKGVVGNFVNIAKNALINRQIDKFSRNPSELYLNSRRREFFTKDPVTQVRNMFNGGIWLNTYELPFYGKDYLVGNFSKNWKVGTMQDSLGKGIAAIASSLGVDYPSNPKFTAKMDETRPNLVTEFYLINSNSSWLEKNFQFIQAIFAGTSWVHLTYCMVRPTNIYHVLCPGRFQMYWAAMDCEVTFEGKLRKNPEFSKKLSKTIKSIDENMLWPDAWKIKLTIKDLTPNNFNLYADYYENGYCAEEVAALGNQIKLDEMVNNLVTYLSGMFAEAKDAASDIGKDVFNQAANVVNSAINLGNQALSNDAGKQ